MGTNGDDGYPNIKAMIKMENEDLKTVWFSSNTSSKRVAQLARDPKVCVYFIDFEQWKGLMLVGRVELLQDQESRQRLWRPAKPPIPPPPTEMKHTQLNYRAGAHSLLG